MADLPSLPDATPSECVQICEKLAYADLQAKKWADIIKALKIDLLALHASGKIPTKFLHKGAAFALLDGKPSVKMDEITKTKIEEIRAAAVASGAATITQGDPYWTIKQPKA